jgi:hypothetical protein
MGWGVGATLRSRTRQVDVQVGSSALGGMAAVLFGVNAISRFVQAMARPVDIGPLTSPAVEYCAALIADICPLLVLVATVSQSICLIVTLLPTPTSRDQGNDPDHRTQDGEGQVAHQIRSVGGGPHGYLQWVSI